MTEISIHQDEGVLCIGFFPKGYGIWSGSRTGRTYLDEAIN